MDLSGTQSRPTAAIATTHWFEQVERWISRRWVPALVNLLALVLLSYSLAQGTWRLVTPASQSGPSQGGTTDNSGSYDLQALLSANLFGQVAAEAKPAVALDAIPLSKLSLVLTGVMVTPAGSFALISADGGPETPFSVGQEISTNVTLYSVYSDRVLIQRGAAVESLMLKDTTEGLPNNAITAPRRTASRIGIQRNSNNSFTISRDQLTQQMQTPEFLTQALMVPNAGGGFLVREIQPGSVYEKLGLRVGDVIKKVNGQSVNSVEDVMRLYGQFSSTSNVQIDVRRAGRDESLVYNIQ